jgi:ketosteroid isomerase-like protein
MPSNLKDKIQELITSVAEGNIDFLTDLVHPDISMLTIDIATGEELEVHGKQKVIQAFSNSIQPPNDLKFKADKIISEFDKICVLGYFIGTAIITPMGLIRFDEPFRIRVTIYFEYILEKIKRIEYYYDTFEVMRLCGTAFLQQDDQSKISDYLQTLIVLGLISEENIRN